MGCGASRLDVRVAPARVGMVEGEWGVGRLLWVSDGEEESLLAQKVDSLLASGALEPPLAGGARMISRQRCSLCHLCRVHGVPSNLRWAVYSALLNIPKRTSEYSGLYRACLAAGPASKEDAGVIDRDLPRTMPHIHWFRGEQDVEGDPSTPAVGSADGERVWRTRPEGQRRLRRILRAWNALDPSVGYCQGMSFLCAALLCTGLQEESAFWVFVSLMYDCGLVRLYEDGLAGTRAMMRLVTELLRRHFPRLASHLIDDLGVVVDIPAIPWVMTVFVSSSLPLASALCILDCVILEQKKKEESGSLEGGGDGGGGGGEATTAPPSESSSPPPPPPSSSSSSTKPTPIPLPYLSTTLPSRILPRVSALLSYHSSSSSLPPPPPPPSLQPIPPPTIGEEGEEGDGIVERKTAVDEGAGVMGDGVERGESSGEKRDDDDDDGDGSGSGAGSSLTTAPPHFFPPSPPPVAFHGEKDMLSLPPCLARAAIALIVANKDRLLVCHDFAEALCILSDKWTIEARRHICYPPTPHPPQSPLSPPLPKVLREAHLDATVAAYDADRDGDPLHPRVSFPTPSPPISYGILCVSSPTSPTPFPHSPLPLDMVERVQELGGGRKGKKRSGNVPQGGKFPLEGVPKEELSGWTLCDGEVVREWMRPARLWSVLNTTLASTPKSPLSNAKISITKEDIAKASKEFEDNKL